jgi:hypothetical protein
MLDNSYDELMKNITEEALNDLQCTEDASCWHSPRDKNEEMEF